MIGLRKLESLAPGHRRRKAAATLEALERALRDGQPIDREYARALLSLLAVDTGLSAELRRELAVDAALLDPARSQSEATESQAVLIGALNRSRRDLGVELNLPCADWDLLAPLEASGKRTLERAARRAPGGMRLYLEDLRSPFNVGSAFRSADAFAVEELLLSPFCADPRHARAERSAMGAVDALPWRRAELADLEGLGTVFALELGGVPLDEFEFPTRGVAILGSEELGCSPEALERAEARVSIPMHGAKASLNVGVALGILLHAWRQSLQGE